MLCVVIIDILKQFYNRLKHIKAENNRTRWKCRSVVFSLIQLRELINILSLVQYWQMENILYLLFMWLWQFKSVKIVK